jgi:hypothetical protein
MMFVPHRKHMPPLPVTGIALLLYMCMMFYLTGKTPRLTIYFLLFIIKSRLVVDEKLKNNKIILLHIMSMTAAVRGG